MRALNKLYGIPDFINVVLMYPLVLLELIRSYILLANINFCKELFNIFIYKNGNLRITMIYIILSLLLYVASNFVIGFLTNKFKYSLTTQFLKKIFEKETKLRNLSHCKFTNEDRFIIVDEDVERVVSSIMSKIDLSTKFIILPSYIIYGITVNIYMTLIITVTAILLSLKNKKNKELYDESNEEWNDAYDNWAKYFEKCLANMILIHNFLDKDKILKQNKKRSVEYKNITVKSLVAYLNVCLVEESFEMFFSTLEISFMFILLYFNKIEFSEIIVMIQILDTIQKDIFGIPTILLELKEVKNISKRINEYLSLKEKDGEELNVSSITSISIKNLKYSFEEVNILNNINYEFKKGNYYMIIGESGSGKTTLVKLLLDFLPSNNSIFIDCKDLKNISKQSYYTHVEYVSQTPYFINGSIYDNLFLDNNVSLDLFNKIQNLLFLEGSRFDEENVKNIIIEEDGTPLSSGEKELVVFLRAACSNKDVIILDEVSAGLDPKREYLIHDLLKYLAKNKIVIMITHRINNLSKADVVLRMNKNKLEKV